MDGWIDAVAAFRIRLVDCYYESTFKNYWKNHFYSLTSVVILSLFFSCYIIISHYCLAIAVVALSHFHTLEISAADPSSIYYCFFVLFVKVLQCCHFKSSCCLTLFCKWFGKWYWFIDDYGVTFIMLNTSTFHFVVSSLRLVNLQIVTQNLHLLYRVRCSV